MISHVISHMTSHMISHMTIVGMFFLYRIRRYRLQLLPLHDMDGSDIDSEDDEEEEREEDNSSEREPVFTVSSFCVGPVLIARINLIIANYEFSRVCKLLIRKIILLIAHPYVQFAQTQLLNSQCS